MLKLVVHIFATVVEMAMCHRLVPACYRYQGRNGGTGRNYKRAVLYNPLNNIRRLSGI